MLTTRMLTPDTWDDFAELVETNNGGTPNAGT